MTVTQVLGAKVQPTFADPAEWNNTRTYAPLTIVLHEGNSFTSKQYVPIGIDITNTDFWAETGNYNAQIEVYRKEVKNLDSFVNETIVPTINENSSAIAEVNSKVVSIHEFNVKDYGAKGDGKTDDTEAFKAAIAAANKSIKGDYVVFSNKGIQEWQANIYVPKGMYIISETINIPTANSLATTNDDRVCGINLIGQSMPIIDFGGNNGFNVNGAFFTCKNIQLQNTSTAFHFIGSKHTPYVEFEDVIIRNSNYGIIADTGFYMSRFTHVIGILITETFMSLGNGTSVIIADCYSAGGAKVAYDCGTMIYSTMISCACDGAEIAYRFGSETLTANITDITLLGCGAESVTKNYLAFRNMKSGNFNVIGFNFCNPTKSITSFVAANNCPNTTLTFNGSVFTNISSEFSFIDKTSAMLVNVDFSNPNIKLPNTAIAKQNNTIFSYIVSTTANVAFPIANLKTSDSYAFAKVHVECIKGNNSLQHFEYTVNVIVNIPESQFGINANGYQSIPGLTPTFTYDLDNQQLLCNFENASHTDLRIYIKNELYTNMTISDI